MAPFIYLVHRGNGNSVVLVWDRPHGLQSIVWTMFTLLLLVHQMKFVELIQTAVSLSLIQILITSPRIFRYCHLRLMQTASSTSGQCVGTLLNVTRRLSSVHLSRLRRVVSSIFKATQSISAPDQSSNVI